MFFMYCVHGIDRRINDANWTTGRDNTVGIAVYSFPRVQTDLIASPRDFLAELRELYSDDDLAA